MLEEVATRPDGTLDSCLTMKSDMWVPQRDERRILETLDALLRRDSVRRALEPVVRRVEDCLASSPAEPLAWEPLDVSLYGSSLPHGIRSSWVFVLRANTVSGAERHPNSIQRVMSYRGSADLQTKPGPKWDSNPLVSRTNAPLERRWLSIPAGVWHQGVMGSENWVVVSFHTVQAEELIEERPETNGDGTRKRTYVESPEEQ